MDRQLKSGNGWAWQDNGETILPMMTALFVDSLGIDVGQRSKGAFAPKANLKSDQGSKIFNLSLDVDELGLHIRKRVEKSSQNAETRIFSSPSQGKHQDRQEAVRTLIGGISKHFNNLLMGIWGNITLVRSRLDESNELYEQIAYMEQLIHGGAFLINVVLGYIGERHYIAKQALLDQLTMEIRGQKIGKNIDDDPWNFTARLKWASRVQRPRLIAGSTARVLEMIFSGIKECHAGLEVEKENDTDIRCRLNNVMCLISRGLSMTRQLHAYAGDYCKSFSTVDLALLVKQILRDRTKGKNLNVQLEVSENLKSITADKRALAWSIEEVIDNACQAMPEGGRLAVAVCHLFDEQPADRCIVQKGSDYVVVSIKDSGSGIPRKIQRHIFAPFYSHPETNKRKGLGLAAADGILRAHNGYIHVQSDRKSGSTFKLYIPTAGTAFQGLSIKHGAAFPKA